MFANHSNKKVSKDVLGNRIFPGDMVIRVNGVKVHADSLDRYRAIAGIKKLKSVSIWISD